MQVVFIGLPMSGHINPTLQVVRELVERGHRVVYPTIAQRREEIEAAGAEAPVYESTFRTEVPGKEQWMTKMRLAMVAETRSVLPQLQALVETPQVVVHDRAAFWGKLFAAKRAVRTIQVVPSFAANAHWAVTHKFAPVDTEAPEHHEYLAKLNALLSEHEIVWDEIQPFDRQIVFLPKAFQYEQETFGDETCFVGPCLRPAEGRWKPKDDRPVMLISMGSLNTEQPDFYRRCLESFGDRWQVVMAIGDRVDRASLGPVPEHFDIMPFVPQLDVLAHAKVFLCHGGMGSTMEALHFGVPLVQVPLTPEQEANAARVAELGLGESVDPAGDIAAAVERVANDSQIRVNVNAMSEQARNAGGARLAADLIEAALAPARQG